MNDTNKPPRRVAVIGAGFGGLACAFELSEAGGYVVDVFEARNRLGGRVRSQQEFAPGQHVEYGAELIGKNQPNWLRYAKRFGIELIELKGDVGGPAKTISLDDKTYRGAEAAALEKEMDAGYDEFTRDAAVVNVEELSKTPDAERLDRMSTADRIKTLHVSELAKRALTIDLEILMAVAAERMNYLALLATIQGHGGATYWTDSEVLRTKSGNQILASRLAAGIQHGTVRLDCPVQSVRTETDGMVVGLSGGENLMYDDVVLAVPPSVWDKIEFSPVLPKSLRPQMGAATKYLTACKTRFWHPQQSPNSFTDSLATRTWEGPHAAEGPGRSLVGFAGGSLAEKLHAIPFAEKVPALRKAFEELMPGYEAAYLKSEFVDWPGEPWSRAGYSFPAPGEFLAQCRVFDSGIGHLHFAGEHTSHGFIGYMEGALESGVRAAKRLIQRDLGSAHQ